MQATHRHSHRPTLRSFDDDGFNIQNPDTAINKINSTLNRFGSLLNNAAIKNVSKSAKDRIQASANRLNGHDINKTLGKITEALEMLTAQQDESTLNATTPKGPTPETKLPPGTSLRKGCCRYENHHMRTDSRGTTEL